MNHNFFDFEIYQSPTTDIPKGSLLGQNEKKLLLVLAEVDFTTENEQFLTKILGAVKHDLGRDTLRLMIPKGQSFGINKLLMSDKIDKVILFGINPKDIGLSIETFVYKSIHLSGKEMLIAHSLDKISKTQELKKALWTSLQQMFLKNTE